MVVVGMKHIVCFSGGHSSAIAAVEVVRRYGAENTILLNHDLCPRTEDEDIKRFKNEVSDYLGVPITYANMPGWEVKDQFDVCMEIKAFKSGAQSTAFCTNRLKTEPFHKWLSEHYPTNPPQIGHCRKGWNKHHKLFGKRSEKTLRRKNGIPRKRNQRKT